MKLGLLFAVAFFLLLLACFLAPRGCEKTPSRHLCPRTHAAATVKGELRIGGKCYEVHTCSGECHKSLQKLATASKDAFCEKYGVENTSQGGVSGLHLCHHVNKQPAQFAVEVPCAVYS